LFGPIGPSPGTNFFEENDWYFLWCILIIIDREFTFLFLMYSYYLIYRNKFI
jgi:hypothetical protein